MALSIGEMTFDHLIGQEFGTATLLNELGRGGMAVIFLAYQRTLKRQIAVKIMPKSLLTPSAAELFQMEAESAAILSHPNIIQIYEVGDTDEVLFFTMQLIQGRPLSDFIKRAAKHVVPSKRFLPLTESIKLTIDILDALAYAHNQDLVHKDIKPANILMEKHTRRPIITDFGISRSTRSPDAAGVKILGSPVYIAPEQLLSSDVDGRADIYATGVMLFEMLTTKLPFAPFGSMKEFLKGKLADRLFARKPSEMNPAVGPEMDGIVFKAVARDPEQRYANCREFSNALARYMDRSSASGGPR
jgi:serine/threonine protein kinase